MKKIIFVALLFCSGIVSAYAPVNGEYWMRGGSPYSRASTAPAACAAYIAGTQGNTARAGSAFIDATTYQCNVLLAGVSPSSVSIQRFSGLTCTDGSTPNTSLPLAQQCGAASCQPVGTVYGAGTEAYSSGLSLNVCDNGCGATASGAMKVGDKFIVFGPMTSTGKCTAPTTPPPIPNDRCSYRGPTGQCEAACPTGSTYRMVPTGAMACVKTAPDTPEQPKDTTCPRGYLNISSDPANPNCAPTGGLGNMNPSGPATCPAGQQSTSSNGGASYCVFTKNDQQPADTSTTKTPETTATNPDGSVTKTTQTTTTNKDGSTTTTTTKTTTSTDGKVTTTSGDVTTKTPGGKDGVSDGKPEDKFDLCKTNPNLNICKNASVTTVIGTDGCATSTCDGDAITCAILRQQQAQYCAENKVNPQSTLAMSVLNGSDPLAASLPSKDSPLSINVQTLNQDSFLGAASCFPDKSVQMLGSVISLPFSKVCEQLDVLRFLVMTVAALASLKIISKPVLGD